MAGQQFPYILETGFESGALEGDTALTDASAKGSYIHYATLIRKHNIVPWRGAYCFLIDQDIGNAADPCLHTQAAMNIAASGYFAVGFALYLKGTTMTNGDRSTICKLVSAAGDETTLQLYYTTAGGLKLLLTEAQNTAVGTNPAWSISENEWHWIELHGQIDNGVGNNGSCYCRMDGTLQGTISSLDQGAITDLEFGLDDQDAGHTAGLVIFDDVIAMFDDAAAARVGLRKRRPWDVHVSSQATTTRYYHLFVGPGTLREAKLLSNNAGDLLRFFDTDECAIDGQYGCVAEATEDADFVVSGPIAFERGCLVEVKAAGANGARGLVSIDPAPPSGYPKAMCYANDAVLKSYALRRKAIPGV